MNTKHIAKTDFILGMFIVFNNHIKLILSRIRLLGYFAWTELSFGAFSIFSIPRNSPGNPRGTIFTPRFPGEGKSSPKYKP